MKSNEIEKIITDQKEVAKRLASALLAAATISGGAVALTSCDDLDLPKNPDTSASEMTSGLPSEQLTNEVTGEVTSADETEEMTTEGREAIDYEAELIALLSKDYPEYKNGIYAFALCKFDEGTEYESFNLSLCCKDENGNQFFTSNICIIDFNEETFNTILSNILDSSTEVYPGQYTLYTENLSPEIYNYIYPTYYNLYTEQYNIETTLEQ